MALGDKTIDFDFEHILDPVHGPIGISALEKEIIDTKVFQRLRNIKQLGLASLVYPSASFSRFTHSLGVCHVATRILRNKLHRKMDGTNKYSDTEIQLCRLAALLHDIGHFPFSHTMEQALKNYFGVEEKNGRHQMGGKDGRQLYCDHEAFGSQVLEFDPEIRKILEREEIDPSDISNTFGSRHEGKFRNLISSDLDADRLDYLLRNAYFSGAPYGSVDIDYLIGHLKLSDDGLLAVDSKAIKTADHFLLGRYFDYQQLIYQRDVAGFELILKHAIRALLDIGAIDCSKEGLLNLVKNQEWWKFDDQRLYEKLRDLYGSPNQYKQLPVVQRASIEMLFSRKPPNVIRKEEFFCGEKNGGERYTKLITTFDTFKEEYAEVHSLDKDQLVVWNKKVEICSICSNPDEDDFEKAIHVMPESGEENPYPLMKDERSLMSVVTKFRYYAVRLYVIDCDLGLMNS